MRNKILMSAAAAFLLSSVSGAGVVVAASPAVKAEQKAAKQDNPAVADNTITQYAAKDAKKQAHKAHKKAKLAAHKAKVAAKKAEKAAKAEGAPPASQ